MVTLATAWQIGLTFPGVEKSTAYGNPALKVRGKLMAAVPTNKSAEPGSIMVRIDRNDRAALLAESPDLYYAPDHYLDYDAVLVRLARLTPDLLRDLLAMAHKVACPERMPSNARRVERVTRKPPARKPRP
ncbi:MAG: MmcQ/YjbR family DNA-binding protein [Acidobacteriaceae bacterium]